MFFRRFCFVAVACLLFANAVFAQNIQVLRFLDNNEGAIVKTADGKTKTIKVGDKITSCEFRVAGCESKDTKHGTRNTEQKVGLRVTEISEGRIVFEEKTNRGIETVIIRVENGKQKIERISKVGDAPQVIYQSK